jgi:type VI secretion system protein ImpH
MATEDRMSTFAIKNSYDGGKEAESFFALVRQYERHYIHACKSDNDSYTKIGEDGSPAKEAIRFKSVKSLGFSVDSINTINLGSDKPDQYEFFVSFMGLLGAAGVLPQHYIKLALQRIKQGDYALSEFIGLFEHRLISLYYKAWGKYKLSVQYEASDQEGEDGFSTILKSFSGFYHGKTAQVYYAGHYSKNNRSLSNLQKMIQEVVSTDVYIQQMVGQWLPINSRDRCVSGVNGKNHQLGTGIILGKRYWDIQSKITIGISGLSMEQYLSLHPSEPLYDVLASMVNAYVPVHIRVEFTFTVNSHQKYVSKIGQGFQLSSNAWLVSKKKNILLSKRLLNRN